MESTGLGSKSKPCTKFFRLPINPFFTSLIFKIVIYLKVCSLDQQVKLYANEVVRCYKISILQTTNMMFTKNGKKRI